MSGERWGEWSAPDRGEWQTSYEEGRSYGQQRTARGNLESQISRLEQQVNRLSREIDEVRFALNDIRQSSGGHTAGGDRMVSRGRVGEAGRDL